MTNGDTEYTTLGEQLSRWAGKTIIVEVAPG